MSGEMRRPCAAVLALVLAGAVAGCGDDSRGKPGPGDADAGPGDDATLGGGDGGRSDARVPGRVRDAGPLPRPDASLPGPDTGPPPADGGPVPPADTGPPTDDARVPARDGTPPEGDAGAPELDGGEAPDLGPPPRPDDRDRDGFTPGEGDCDDEEPAMYPGAPELCDGLDNDCDGITDDGVTACYGGPPNTLGLGSCRPGTRACDDGVPGACEGEVQPRAEACGNGADDDCDGMVDEGCDEDGDGFTVDAGDCDDGDPAVNPGAAEICNGRDDDCDGTADGLVAPCYEGPEGTAGIGTCAAGARTCVDGALGDCEGQTLPAAEACGNALDDDCDGQVDEGCEDLGCDDIDLDSPVAVTSECLAAGSGAQAVAMVRLRDVQGNPLVGRNVELTWAPALPMSFRQTAEVNGTYYRGVLPTAAPQTSRLTVTVGCGAARIALRGTATVRVVARTLPGSELVTAGCPLQGDLQALVTDRSTGALLPGAWLMAGPAPAATFQDDATRFVTGRAGSRPNAVTAEDGRPRLRDYGAGLRGPRTVTVGAEGYENVTLVDVDASVLNVPLRRVAPPAPPRATLRGRLTDFDDLRRDGMVDLGLAVGSFDLPFLSTVALGRLLSRLECWDPVSEGLGGALVGPQPIPGNVYVPRQQEQAFGVPVQVDEHRFALDVADGRRRDELVGLAGRLPADQVLQVLSRGGGLNDLLRLMTLTEIGVLPDQPFDADRNDLAVPLATRLRNDALCRVAGSPAGADVFCVAAGDWSGADGTGRLFPMGFGTIDADTLRRGPAEIRLTTVGQGGVFRGIGYVGAAVALFLDPQGAPDGLGGAASAVLDRRGLGPQGGVVDGRGFFAMTRVARQGRTVTWTPVEAPGSPAPDLCRVEIVRSVRDRYDPGACSPARTDVRELPVWTGYAAGDPGRLALPTLPAAWPRAADGGLVSTAATPEDDVTSVRVSCLRLGLAPGFRYDAGRFGALIDGLTHLSVNDIPY